jgi:hypothetical protein
MLRRIVKRERLIVMLSALRGVACTHQCKFACNSDPLRGDFRVQFRPLLTFCVSVLPCGPDGPGGTVRDGWRGQDRPGTTRLF